MYVVLSHIFMGTPDIRGRSWSRAEREVGGAIAGLSRTTIALSVTPVAACAANVDQTDCSKYEVAHCPVYRGMLHSESKLK